MIAKVKRFCTQLKVAMDSYIQKVAGKINASHSVSIEEKDQSNDDGDDSPSVPTRIPYDLLTKRNEPAAEL